MPASRPAHALGVRGSCVLLLAIRFRYRSGALSFCDRSPLTRMTGHGRWRPTHPGNRSKRETTPLIRRDLPEWRRLSRSGCPDTINTPTCQNGSQLTRAALIHVLRRLLALPTVPATRYVVLRCSPSVYLPSESVSAQGSEPSSFSQRLLYDSNLPPTNSRLNLYD